jgi:hypothetical protein
MRSFISNTDPAHGTPTKILMCAATCSAFSANNGGVVDIEIGCATVVQPPPT